MRMVARLGAVAALALLMSACLKLDMNLDVSTDNTVSGSVIFAVDKGLLELAGQSFDDLIGSDTPFPDDVEGVTVESYEDDDFTGQQYTFDGVPLSEFEGSGDEELSITREGDVFHVAGVLDLATGLTSGATGLSGFDPAEILQSADIQITMSFPGEVTESNGEVSGNSVTWVPEIGERLEITATAGATGSGGDSNLTMLLIIGAVVVVLAVIAGVIVAQRRNRPAPAAAAASDVAASPPSVQPASPAPEAPGTPPPPPPPGPADQP
jgi:hypothetical protein